MNVDKNDGFQKAWILFLVATVVGACSGRSSVVTEKNDPHFKANTMDPIRQTVRSHLREFKDCLKVDGSSMDFPSELKLVWSVDRNGGVSDIVVQKSTTRSDEFDKCVALKVKSWKFENIETKNLKEVVVTYPFHFTKPRAENTGAVDGAPEELYERVSD